MVEDQSLSDVYKSVFDDNLRVASDIEEVALPTGFSWFDHWVMGGGFRRGRLVEIYGKEQSGKSTFMLSVVGVAQKCGMKAAWFDTEGAFDITWARKFGVDLDSLMLPGFSSGEELFEKIKFFVEEDVDVIVVDSLPSIRSKELVESSLEDYNMRKQLSRAMLITVFLESLTGGWRSRVDKTVHRLFDSSSIVFFVNHIKEKPGVSFGVKEGTPGGVALKFLASIRLRVKLLGKIEDTNKEIVGQRISVSTDKNKCWIPFRGSEFSFNYEGHSGLRESGNGILALAVSKGLLVKSGRQFKTQDDKLLGKGKAVEYCFSPDVFKLILDDSVHSNRESVSSDEVEDASEK